MLDILQCLCMHPNCTGEEKKITQLICILYKPIKVNIIVFCAGLGSGKTLDI